MEPGQNPLMSALTHSLLLRDRLLSELTHLRSQSSTALTTITAQEIHPPIHRSRHLQHEHEHEHGHDNDGQHHRERDHEEEERARERRRREKEREKEVEEREREVGRREKWVIEEMRKLTAKVQSVSPVSLPLSCLTFASLHLLRPRPTVHILKTGRAG